MIDVHVSAEDETDVFRIAADAVKSLEKRRLQLVPEQELRPLLVVAEAGVDDDGQTPVPDDKGLEDAWHAMARNVEERRQPRRVLLDGRPLDVGIELVGVEDMHLFFDAGDLETTDLKLIHRQQHKSLR